MDYILHIIILILLYVMLSQSLVLSSGFTGLISLAHAGFFGIGAYTAGILSVNYDLPFLISLIIAVIISGVFALVVSVIALRSVDEYFIIITLGIQVIAFSIMNNWIDLTNGPMGISGIPNLSIFGFTFSSKLSFLILTLFFTVIIFLLLRNITTSPFSRILIGLSNDEIFTKSLGKKVNFSKVSAFAIGGMFATIPGVLYAYYISYIDPTSFTVDESIFILSIVIIAGMRSLWNAAIVAAVLIILPEALRFIGVPSNVSANIQQIIYGIALVIMMIRYYLKSKNLS